MDRDWVAFNAYNLVMITMMAVVGITLAKVVFSKYQVPGLTKLVLAV